MNKGLQGRYKQAVRLHRAPRIARRQRLLSLALREAAILTLDGVGEWATASYGIGRGNRIALTHELRFPHSLGLLYSAFTYLLRVSRSTRASTS